MFFVLNCDKETIQILIDEKMIRLRITDPNESFAYGKQDSVEFSKDTLDIRFGMTPLCNFCDDFEIYFG